MKVITEEEIFNDFAFILEITDDQLDAILNDPARLVADRQLMVEMIQTKGNNAHILQLTIKDTKINILKYVNLLLKVYDSVSWLNNDGKFHIKRNNILAVR